MSDIEKGIYSIIEQFPAGQGPYTEDEVFIDNIVEDFLKKNGITQYSCETESMFENPGCEIFSFSCCWIENGELKSVLNKEIDWY